VPPRLLPRQEIDGDAMIPRHIHQFRNAVGDPGGWREKNIEFQHTLWSDIAAQTFIEREFGGALAKRYNACREPLERSLFFGAAVLLVRGGFYIDCNIDCLLPIAPLAQLKGDVIAVGDAGGTCSSFQAEQLGSGFLAARPRSALMGRLFAALASAPPAPGDTSGWRQVLRSLAEESGIAEKERINWAPPDTVLRFMRTSSQETAHDHTRISRNGVVVLDNVQPRLPFRWAGLLFLGHPRCGSSALSAMLKRAGLRVSHERLGPDGAVTWWLTGRRLAGAAWPAFTYGGSKNREVWLGGRILHYLRDPREAIPSIVLENEARLRENPSFRMRRRRLKERFDIDIGELDPPTAAATSYALWNKLAEDIARDGLVLVEKPDLSALLPEIPSLPLIRSNSSERKFGQNKPEIDIADAIRRSPREARSAIQRYLSIYD